MKSDLPVLSATSAQAPDHGHEGLGYPFRVMLLFGAALGVATADIPVKLRTRMPLVLVTGNGLPALFDRA
ncbi:MAG: Flagellar motor rotation protein MotB [uncultured Caballeronia sp.]|nr:MAG: Flagellar motor rotation protein MotB [uncultured Caballeronia sp.]